MLCTHACSCMLSSTLRLNLQNPCSHVWSHSLSATLLVSASMTVLSFHPVFFSLFHTLFPPLHSHPKVPEWSHLGRCLGGQAAVEMLDFMSCSKIAAGWTDDDTTSSIGGHPEPTLHRFLIQDFEDLHYLILFHSLNIPIFLLFPSVLLNIFSKYHEKKKNLI